MNVKETLDDIARLSGNDTISTKKIFELNSFSKIYNKDPNLGRYLLKMRKRMVQMLERIEKLETKVKELDDG